MKILSIQIAKASPFELNKTVVMSAIRKKPIIGQINVFPLGLEGDEQANRAVHGGLNKAVYAYPSEHYSYWRTQQQMLSTNNPLEFGSLGENLTLSGLLENEVFVGDELHFSECVLRVTEPREPCSKFNAVMLDKLAAKKMIQTGFCGFYLAVMKTGKLIAGEEFTLIQGKREISISEMFQQKMQKTIQNSI